MQNTKQKHTWRWKLEQKILERERERDTDLERERERDLEPKIFYFFFFLIFSNFVKKERILYIYGGSVMNVRIEHKNWGRGIYSGSLRMWSWENGHRVWWNYRGSHCLHCSVRCERESHSHWQTVVTERGREWVKGKQ